MRDCKNLGLSLGLICQCCGKCNRADKQTIIKVIDVFLKEHTRINYCEAIIFPDGTIAYVKPSHVETMLRFTGEDRDSIYDKMPIDASPICWLTEYTKCMPVWSNGYIKPSICTEEQLITLNKLIEHGLVKNNIMI